MPRSITRRPIAQVDSSNLLLTNDHDTSSITPFHVTVIQSIAALIGVDPTETCIELSDYACISAIDNIIDCHDADDDSRPLIAFRYNRDNANLFVVCRSMGDILVYDADECSYNSAECKNGKMRSKTREY